MSSKQRQFSDQRCKLRRKEDSELKDQIRQYKMLFELSQMITSEINLEPLFEVIMEQITSHMNTEKCSVLYDFQNEQLWSQVSTALNKNEIRIPTNCGIAGWVFQNKKNL